MKKNCDDLKKEIEQLREHMHELIDLQDGKLNTDEIIKASKKLDKLLNEYRNQKKDSTQK